MAKKNAQRQLGNCNTTIISSDSIAHDERMNPELCSGYGAYHSNEPGAKNPKPYTKIDINGIRALVDDPQQVDKVQALWLIPSTLLSRNFKEQEVNGQYWAIWADIDKDTPPFDELVEERVKSIIGDHDFEAYTTSSATEQNQKARIIIPLGKPLCFKDWHICQLILNNWLEDEGVTPDRATERAAQLCFLPNRGEFYRKSSSRTGKTFDPLRDWSPLISHYREKIKAETDELEKHKQVAEKRRKALKSSDAPDTIGAFNGAYSVTEILLQAGYEQRGDKFRHPKSKNGSYSATVKNGRVHSLSTADPLYTRT